MKLNKASLQSSVSSSEELLLYYTRYKLSIAIVLAIQLKQM